MAKLAYSLETVRHVIRLYVSLIEALFPAHLAKVTIMEGGWTNAEPWFIRVSPENEARMKFADGFKAVEIRIEPQALMDFVDHGGGKTVMDYVGGLFSKTVIYLADHAKNRAAFVKETEHTMAAALVELGISGIDEKEVN